MSNDESSIRTQPEKTVKSNKKGKMVIGKNGNGTTLAQILPERLSNTATSLIESLKINSVSEQKRRNRPVVVKRRNLHSQQIAEMANLYFGWAGLPIRFWARVKDWRRWEINSFNLLNGDRFQARVSGQRAVIEDKLPGESLWDYMNDGALTRPILVAAAKELRRAHRFWSNEFRGPWSHGDATTTNVIYDAKTNRARWIDFEIIHDKSLSPRSRHADDLLVFLLDMVGIVPSRKWLPFALCFLNAYGEAHVIHELRRQLILPGGLAWIWWEVRTNFTSPAKINKRLTALRHAIAKMELYRSVADGVLRKNRRPSTICHTASAGMPTAKSRHRAIKETAKAVSPGMPKIFPITR